MTTPTDVAATLRHVAALRALCRRLPHLPTPAERTRLDRFEALAANPALATEADVESLAAGWRQWWLDGNAHEIETMARRLPAGLVDGDRELASYAVAAAGGRAADE